MTEPTSLPAARPRKILTQIAAVSWEHPPTARRFKGCAPSRASTRW